MAISLITANSQGGAPAFSAYASGATTTTSGVFTKILFATEEFDTNSNFASSTFTPTVAGYYQINSYVNMGSATSSAVICIYKNGAEYKRGAFSNGSTLNNFGVSSLVYCNGSTDYVEIYMYQSSGGNVNTGTAVNNTWFNGCFVRSA